MSTPVTLEAGTLPPPACYANDQARLEAYVLAITAFLSGDFAAPLIQAATPDPADNDKLWFKLDGSGNSLGSFLYQGGDWKRAEPLSPPPGTIVDFVGNADIVLTGNFTNDSALILTLDGGDSTNPFWRVCDGTNGTPDIRGRVRVGAGQGASLTDRVLAATGGEELHVLTTAELAKHKHPSTTPALLQDSISGGDTHYYGALGDSGEAGGDQGHNTMQPFYVAYTIIRTSRLR